MLMLGDILAAAQRSSSTFQAWLEASGPELSAQLGEAARRAGEAGPAGFIRSAVADFARFASEEDWASLTSRLRNSGDPGTACLLAMVEWRLAAAGAQEHHDLHHVGGGTGR